MSLSITPTTPGNDALTGGFADPVFDAQSVFKMMMDAMARPGTVQTVVSDITPPAPLGIAAGAIGLTLCDHDTPVWLSTGLAKSTMPEWLSFHTGTAVTPERDRGALCLPRSRHDALLRSTSSPSARRNIPTARRRWYLKSQPSRAARNWRSPAPALPVSA